MDFSINTDALNLYNGPPDIIVQNVCRADLKKMLVVLIFVKE